MSLTLLRVGVLFAVGYLGAIALGNGNSFNGYWACLWLAGLCSQMSAGARRPVCPRCGASMLWRRLTGWVCPECGTVQR
jgi:hypothetical protein